MHCSPGLRDKVIDSRHTGVAPRLRWFTDRARRRQLAGTLCPNPVLADGRRLDGVLGNGFALITTVPPDDTQHRLLNERGAVVHIAAPDGELADWLRRARATAAIVRPDRTVMRAGRDMRRICDAVADLHDPRRRDSIECLRRPAVFPSTEQTSTRPTRSVDPYPHYAALRGLGPVVWLPRHRVYALPRYAECKAVLRDDKTFISGKGVALNRLTNRLSRGTTLSSDGAEHDQRRKLVAHRMLPRALRAHQRRTSTRRPPRWSTPR